MHVSRCTHTGKTTFNDYFVHYLFVCLFVFIFCVSGGCHAQEMCVAAAAETFVVCADDRKKSDALGRRWKKGVPVEV